MTIVEFIEARLAEDEAIARAAIPDAEGQGDGHWHAQVQRWTDGHEIVEDFL